MITTTTLADRGWGNVFDVMDRVVNQANSDIMVGGVLPNNKIALFGDSISAQNSSATSGFENYGYITWANQLSRQRFRFEHANNFGVGGNTTAQMLARIDDVIASDASTVVVFGGTNDRGSANLSYQDTVDNLTSIVTRLRLANKVVVFVTPLPRGDSTFTSNRLSGVQLANHLRVRQWILTWRGVAGVYVVDTWPNTAVESSATGDITLGYTHDGLHPNTTGAYYVGKAIATQALVNILPEPSILAASNADIYSADNPLGSVNLNPMFAGTAGSPATGGSGSLADNWSGTNATGTTNVTRTYSKVTSGGKAWQQVVIGGTATTAEAAIDIARQISLQASVVGGATYEGLMEYQVDASAANIMSLQLGLVVTDGTGTTTLWDGDRYTGTSVLPTEAFSGVLRTPRITMPASGITDVRLRVSCYLVNGQAPSGTIRLRAGSLNRIS